MASKTEAKKPRMEAQAKAKGRRAVAKRGMFTAEAAAMACVRRALVYAACLAFALRNEVYSPCLFGGHFVYGIAFLFYLGLGVWLRARQAGE